VNHGTFNVYYDAYNGERIRFFISGGEFFGTTSKKTSILSIILNSTKSSLGQPMYIDLETGEAYNIISGEIVSVNNAVQIPAELPVLSSGANTITYGGTITQFDIVPRWWKV
jgi:phage-related protein